MRVKLKLIVVLVWINWVRVEDWFCCGMIFFNARIVRYSQNFIEVGVGSMTGASWRLSCFYGYSKHTHRRDSWDLLRALVGSNDESWLVMGDFNDIESNSEKEGGDVYHYLIESFKGALANRDLKMLHGIGIFSPGRKDVVQNIGPMRSKIEKWLILVGLMLSRVLRQE